VVSVRRAPVRRSPDAPVEGPVRARLDVDERRRQLVALGTQLFSTRTYDDVSIDEVARTAGISKGLLYHYFPTKRDLYVAALREISDELVRAVTGMPVELSPADQVRASVDAYLEHVARHSRAFVALMRGGIGSDPEVAAVIESVRTRLFDKFLAGSPFASLLAGDPRFETAVRGWIGFAEAASIEWCANPRLSRGELLELLTQVLYQVLRVVAPAIDSL